LDLLEYVVETRQFQLFDLDADIGETVGVGNFTLAAELIGELREWLIATGAWMPAYKGTTIAVPYPAAFTVTATPASPR
jgi:hypothetical protein